MSLVMKDDEDIEVIDYSRSNVGGAVSAIVKSEVEAQLDAAHRYKRSVGGFLKEATMLATMNEEIAASCIYTLPRGGKPIAGPSVRLAEICASAYGNLHVGARVVGMEEKDIVAQGVAWDLEKNLRATIEVRRRITKKDGKRFDDDMITVTGNAAASIGLRNAIFRVIPKAYVAQVYEAARKVAVGDASTLSAKRATVMDRLIKMGAMKERILLRVGKPSVEDINLDDMEMLIGIGTAIKNGEIRADEAFPALTATPERSTVSLEDIKPGKEENRGHGNEKLEAVKQGPPAASLLIDKPMAESLFNLFKDSLKPALRKNAESLYGDWLVKQGIVDANGFGDDMQIRRENYQEVREALALHAVEKSKG